MSKLRVPSFSVSLDGYGAGPNQSLANPLGQGGTALHDWMFRTRGFHQMTGREGGSTGVDDDFFARGFSDIGAWIMGRNMFGPIRGPWPDDEWKGWWGDEPPFHTPVFVLTHHARPSLAMAGGTTFHFVTGGIQDALEQSHKAAGGKDVRLGGGVSTVRRFLAAGLIDELHLVINPILLGAGERLFGNVDTTAYRCTEYVAGTRVTHVVLTR